MENESPLPPEIRDMIRRGNEVRERGGEDYVTALHEERIADRQGFIKPPSPPPPREQLRVDRSATAPSQEQEVRQMDERRHQTASHLGPTAVSSAKAKHHNAKLQEVRDRTGF